MGVERRQGDPPPRHPELAQPPVALDQPLDHNRGGQHFGDPAQRDVLGEKKDAQPADDKESHRLRALSKGGEHFGMIDVGDTPLLQRGLVDRGGDESADRSGPRPLDRRANGGESRPAAAAVDPPHLHRPGKRTRVDIAQSAGSGGDLRRSVEAEERTDQTGLHHRRLEYDLVPEEKRIECLLHPRIRQGFEDDLRADAGRVAQRDADQGLHSTPACSSMPIPSRSCVRSTGSCASMMRRLSSPR